MENKFSLDNCRICPRNCGVNRYQQTGFCGCGANVKINTWQKHFGEEPYISGLEGSGTIFFSGCNLACVFCQNYQISQMHKGKDYTIEELVKIMLELQNSGVHNINLVTPTHFSLQLKQALIMAKQQGLQIPVVWNTNSWEKVEMLSELEGLVDIYLADLKYGDNMMAKKYSAADNYFPIATAAVKEMYRQVGNIVLADNDIAIKGIAIRILVLPHDINSTSKLLHWVADNIGNKVNLSLMSQYYPTYKANKLPELSRNLLYTEYEKAVKVAEKLGFDNCLIQELSPSDYWTPDFDD